jgi:glutamyl-tRNA reductase
VVSRLDAALADAEVVVCTTGAADTLIGTELLQQVLGQRGWAADDDATRQGRDGAHTAPAPLVLLDLGVPRNVDPACAALPGAELIDVSDVRRLAVRGHTGTVLADARRIVEEEVERFTGWTRAAEVEPTIRAIRSQAEAVRQAELERLRGKLATLDDQQRAAVDSLTRGIVNTLLHHPTVRLKELADLGGADPGVKLLRELFDLPEGDA